LNLPLTVIEALNPPLRQTAVPVAQRKNTHKSLCLCSIFSKFKDARKKEFSATIVYRG
jgi:hypothetical protein